MGLIDASDPQQDIDAHQDGVNKKEVVTGHQRDCHQEGIKQQFFLLHDLFQSDAQQRKQDDTHVELRMAFNLIKGVGTERVEDSSGQHVVTLLFHIKTVTGEGNADQIDLKKGQQTVDLPGILLPGHEDAQQVDGVRLHKASHIAAHSDGKIVHGQGELSVEKIGEYIADILTGILQPDQILRHSVRLPDETIFLFQKRKKRDACDKDKNKGVHAEIFQKFSFLRFGTRPGAGFMFDIHRSIPLSFVQ